MEAFKSAVRSSVEVGEADEAIALLKILQIPDAVELALWNRVSLGNFRPRFSQENIALLLRVIAAVKPL